MEETAYRLRKTVKTAWNRKLYSRSSVFYCLWNPTAGSGWKCPSGDYQNYRRSGRYFETIHEAENRRKPSGNYAQRPSGDFNQSLMELGATVCVPNGMAKCEVCPIAQFCKARASKPFWNIRKRTQKQRKIEEKTVLVIQNGQEFAIHKRPSKGLLAGLYESSKSGRILNREEILSYIKKLSLIPLHIAEAGEAKHIFSHVEWHMKGYFIKVASTEEKKVGDLIFVEIKKESEKGNIPFLPHLELIENTLRRTFR